MEPIIHLTCLRLKATNQRNFKWEASEKEDFNKLSRPSLYNAVAIMVPCGVVITANDIP